MIKLKKTLPALVGFFSILSSASADSTLLSVCEVKSDTCWYTLARNRALVQHGTFCSGGEVDQSLSNQIYGKFLARAKALKVQGKCSLLIDYVAQKYE